MTEQTRCPMCLAPMDASLLTEHIEAEHDVQVEEPPAVQGNPYGAFGNVPAEHAFTDADPAMQGWTSVGTDGWSAPKDIVSGVYTLDDGAVDEMRQRVQSFEEAVRLLQDTRAVTLFGMKGRIDLDDALRLAEWLSSGVDPDRITPYGDDDYSGAHVPVEKEPWQPDMGTFPPRDGGWYVRTTDGDWTPAPDPVPRNAMRWLPDGNLWQVHTDVAAAQRVAHDGIWIDQANGEVYVSEHADEPLRCNDCCNAVDIALPFTYNAATGDVHHQHDCTAPTEAVAGQQDAPVQVEPGTAAEKPAAPQPRKRAARKTAASKESAE